MALALRPSEARLGEGDDGQVMPGLDDLWGAVERLEAPLLLVRGGTSPEVDDEDVAEVMRRNPTARVVVVGGAGHSVQGDKPLELAEILRGLL